jgi:hypothetical protein
LEPLVFFFVPAAIISLCFLNFRRQARRRRKVEQRQAELLMQAITKMRGYRGRYAPMMTSGIKAPCPITRDVEAA